MGSELTDQPDDERTGQLPPKPAPGFEEEHILDDDLAPEAETLIEPASVGLSITNLTGQQIGRYRIERQIGSGGVAIVYQAYDQVDGVPVALKVLMPHADANTYSRFRREALTAGGLHYEHIVRIRQVGTLGPGGLAYIAMELVEGESLSELLNKHSMLHPQESCNLLEPIARALDHAHQAGIVHRDVKPSNILLRTVSPGAPNSVQLETLDHPVVPLLSDFGVARYLDAPELTNTGRTVGTPAYMAPEQCAGKRDVDGRADIYALGCVLYRCVTGRLPFAGSVTQILHAHVYDPLVIDHESMQRLPPALIEILRHSLAKDPADRYQRIGEMAHALAFAAGRTPTRRQPVAQDATATLTLSSLPPTTPTTANSPTTVLVPAPPAARTTSVATRPAANPLTTRTVRPVQAAATANPAPVREERFYRFTWAALPIALAVLVFAIAVALINSPFGLGRGENPPPTNSEPGIAILPSATVAQDGSVPTFTATSIVTDTQSESSPTAAITSVPGDVVSTPALPEEPTTPSEEVSPTSLPTWTPEPTVTETPSPTPSPTLSPTATLTPIPTLTWTPEPTATETPAPTATPPPLAGGCNQVADPLWSSFITSQASEVQPSFACALTPPLTVNVEVLEFEMGTMLRTDLRPDEIYVFYNSDNRWEVINATWQEGEPVVPEAINPIAERFLPVRVFGKVWQDERIRVELGFALTPEPAMFPGRMQEFPGGTLFFNYATSNVRAFLADRRL